MDSDKSKLVEVIAQEIGLTEELSKEFIKIALKQIKVFDQKQHDYGSNNISDFGEIGVIVRMNDKMARIKNLTKNGADPANEPLDDSYSDISNYALIALMVRKGLWQ